MLCLHKPSGLTLKTSTTPVSRLFMTSSNLVQATLAGPLILGAYTHIGSDAEEQMVVAAPPVGPVLSLASATMGDGDSVSYLLECTPRPPARPGRW